MSKYTIETQDHGHRWTATFDGFDGAPDATGRCALQGSGPGEMDAIVDLFAEDGALDSDLEAK